LWDIIESSSSKTKEGKTKYENLSRILRIAHALPTSSACIEQSFFSLKFIKNNLRSNLKEKTIESLILISQEFSNKEVIITQTMLESYHKIKEELNQRKSQNNSPVEEEIKSSLEPSNPTIMEIESSKEPNQEEEEIDINDVIKRKVDKLNTNSQNNSKKRPSFPGRYLSPEGPDRDVVFPVLKKKLDLNQTSFEDYDSSSKSQKSNIYDKLDSWVA